MSEFDGKALTSVAKGGLDLGKLEDEAERKEKERDEAEEQHPAGVLSRLSQ